MCELGWPLKDWLLRGGQVKEWYWHTSHLNQLTYIYIYIRILCVCVWGGVNYIARTPSYIEVWTV